jgi:hypothetical protein
MLTDLCTVTTLFPMYYHTLAEMLIIKLVRVICKFFKRLGNSKSEQYYVCCFHSIPQQSSNMDQFPHGDHIDKEKILYTSESLMTPAANPLTKHLQLQRKGLNATTCCTQETYTQLFTPQNTTTESRCWFSHKLLYYGHTTCQTSQLTNEHTGLHKQKFISHPRIK